MAEGGSHDQVQGPTYSLCRVGVQGWSCTFADDSGVWWVLSNETLKLWFYSCLDRLLSFHHFHFFLHLSYFFRVCLPLCPAQVSLHHLGISSVLHQSPEDQ